MIKTIPLCRGTRTAAHSKKIKITFRVGKRIRVKDNKHQRRTKGVKNNKGSEIQIDRKTDIQNDIWIDRQTWK